ncbi:DMT family transporter [Pontibacter chinhatensis]|uniref:EamA-like transporter family protein n=1 Tax=Pontibacter chinhatensis TaxID=1436961 RepID=A0A1I2TIY8_9BACT|nr:DMT family transporter [Pontibacter chinhatensis]SFG64069.1 EamA-like transporter family protein [Pontibacter chinhatensis]
MLVIILALIWGTSFILIKKGLVVYAPNEVGALRMVIACAALLPFAIRNVRKVEPHRWKFLLGSGMLGNFLPAFLFAIAETRVASGLAGVLNSLTALFTLLVGAALFGQSITWMRMLGIVIGIAGTAILIFTGNGNAELDNMYYGLYIVLATVFYGISANLIKFRLQGMKAIAVSSLALLTVGPLALVYLLTTDFLYKLQHVPGAWEALMYIAILAVFSTAIALILFNKLIQISTTLFASSTTYLIPIVALMWGVLDGETIHLWHYLGMVVILLGVFIVNRAK